MKYKKTKIDNYNLHMINIDNFKSITVDVIFSIPTSKEVITKSNFLFSILDFSSKKYSTRRELEIEKENLYSSEIDILNFCKDLDNCWLNYIKYYIFLLKINTIHYFDFVRQLFHYHQLIIYKYFLHDNNFLLQLSFLY